MGGRTWTLYAVVVVVLYSLQASTAQELINLVEPRVSYQSPTADNNYWKIFDRDLSTSGTVNPYPLYMWFWIIKNIRPTHYRIIMDKTVAKVDYPSSWALLRREFKNPNAPDTEEFNEYIDEVSGAVFNNGVYEGALSQPVDIFFFSIDFGEKKVTIAEIELLGPRSALDALWPFGKYPCSQRHERITSLRGPEKIWSNNRMKSSLRPGYLRPVFDARTEYQNRPSFKIEGNKPIIIGAMLPSSPMVHEVEIGLDDLIARYVGRIELQGSFCSNPSGGPCVRFGRDSWVTLATGKLLRRFFASGRFPGYGFRFSIENPDKYVAYRVRYLPREPAIAEFQIWNISFLGCTA